MTNRTYVETFDDGPGGWFGWTSNQAGPKRLIEAPSALISRSPWWIDYNHAPPGAGYLHMLFCLLTKGAGYGEAYMEAGDLNRFIDAASPTDFRNARVTVRLRGELETRGAQVVFLVQGTHDGITSGWALTGSPVKVSPDWSEQTLVTVPSESQWTCLGSRHDRTKTYGRLPLERVLGDVNADILLILFPLEIVPMGPIAGDPHVLRPGRDYPVWTSRLPEGYIELDEVRVAFQNR
jgi:hypothetical protein